jgi:uncharacterized membrane protein
MQRYINNSIYGVDSFLQSDNWIFSLKINNYELVMFLWNMGLMVVPWLMTTLLRQIWRRTHFHGIPCKLLGMIVFFIWLLFIPNTAYVMTEVRHLLDYCPRDSAFQVCEQNAWMSLFFFIYALFGWVFFVCLTDQMRYLLEDIFNQLVGVVFVAALMPVMALGLLFGLINRWNSWEFFIYPDEVAATIPAYFQDPVYFANWLIFSIFLYFLYFGGRWLLKDRFR